MSGPRVNVIERQYTPRRAMAQLFKLAWEGCPYDELLLDGPAGTGKSRCTGQFLHWTAENYPGSRMLVVRQTRASLTESWMATFEEHVLEPGHEAAEGPKALNRHSYDYDNGSRIVMGGLDKPGRMYSTEWDVVLVVEAFEVSLDAWERFHRALRHQVTPYQLLIGETNPDTAEHWLNQRCLEGKCHRLVTTHKDNPRYWDSKAKRWTEHGEQFMRKLHMLSGVRRKRLLDGVWCAAEGQIWEEFDRDIHVIQTLPKRGIRFDRNGKPIWRAVIASVDWGYRAPGVIQIWGVDQDGRMYLIREVYRQGITVTKGRNLPKQSETWLEWAKALHAQYKVTRWVCDPAEPEFIDHFREAGLPAVEGDNAVIAGLDAVRSRLKVQQPVAPGPGEQGVAPLPRMMFMANALRERDPELHEQKQPCCTVEEIPAYVYPLAQDGKPIKETPDPACADHGCDATRYAAMEVDRIFTPERQKKKWRRNSFGSWLDHDAEQ